MNAAEFKAGLITLWGDDWRKKAPEAFGVNVTTIDRWVTPEGRPNHAKVHPTAAKLLPMLLKRAKRVRRERATRARYLANKAART